MITGGKPWELNGLSTDDKYDSATINLEKIPNGSTLLEMDTGKVFKYDAENKTWIEI